MFGTITTSESISICEFGCGAGVYEKMGRLKGVEESAGREEGYICKPNRWDGIKSSITAFVSVLLY